MLSQLVRYWCKLKLRSFNRIQSLFFCLYLQLRGSIFSQRKPGCMVPPFCLRFQSVLCWWYSNLVLLQRSLHHPTPPTITTIHKSVCFSPLLFISIQDLSSVSTLITFASSSFYLFLCTSYFLVRKLILPVSMTIQFVVVSTMVRMHH